jgi:hypothetical protein
MRHLARTLAPSGREKGKLIFAGLSCDIIENKGWKNLTRRLSCDVHENKPVVFFYPTMLLITRVVNTF